MHTQQAEPAGAVYIVASATIGDNWSKVGLASLRPGKSLTESIADRLRGYHTSLPARDHEVHQYYPVYGCKKRLREAEKVAHTVLEEVLGKQNKSHEWFNASPAAVDALIRGELEQYQEPPETPKVTITIQPWRYT